MAEARPGWYHGKGDPEGTVRYWDGEQWVGDPVMAPEAPPPPAFESARVPQMSGPVARTEVGGSFFSRLVSPHGRINRVSVLGVVGMAIALVLPLSIIDIAAGTDETGFGVFGTLGSLAFLWPQLASASKRFHDFGLSGWFAILTVVPLLNLGALVWLLVHPGKPEENRFGPPPPPGFNL